MTTQDGSETRYHNKTVVCMRQGCINEVGNRFSSNLASRGQSPYILAPLPGGFGAFDQSGGV